MLFGIPPDPKVMEVYNDFNSDLTNLYACVKNHTMEFLRQLGFLPLNGRDEFLVLRRFLEGQEFAGTFLAQELELAMHNLPPGILESMCLNPGNLVTLEFAPTSPVKEANGYGPRFQVETGGCETDIIADEEEAALVVPHDLLNDAHIPMDTGLVVQTIPGAILIGDTDPMAAVQAPLLEILSLFGISEEEAYKAIEEGGYYDE